MNNSTLSVSTSRNIVLTLIIFYPVFAIFFYKGYFLLALMGLLSIIFIDSITNRGRLWLDTRSSPVYVFFLLPIVSALWAKYPDETLWRGSLVLVNIAVFYLASRANVRQDNRLITAISIVFPLVVLLAFFMIALIYGSIRPTSSEAADEIGMFSNLGGAIVVLCVPYLFALLQSKSANFMVWTALASSVLVILLSQSRGAYFILLVGIILSVYFLSANIKVAIVRTLGLSVFILIVGFLVFFTIGIGSTVAPVLDRFKESQLVSVMNEAEIVPIAGKADFGRTVMYAEGVRAIIENPFQGIGYGGLARYIEDRYGFSIVSHNLIISILGEMGLPGLMVFIWLLFSVIFRLYRTKKMLVSGSFEYLIVSATLVSIILIVLHAQFRPVFLNPMLPILLAQVYARNGMDMGNGRKGVYFSESKAIPSILKEG